MLENNCTYYKIFLRENTGPKLLTVPKVYWMLYNKILENQKLTWKLKRRIQGYQIN